MNRKTRFMTHIDLEFFTNGSFLRTPSGELYLWQNLQGTTLETNFSIGYLEFFESQLKLLKSSEPIRMSVGTLRAELTNLAPKEPANLKNESFSFPQLSEFEKSFQEIQAKIHRGEIEKAVPIVFAKSQSSVNQADLISMLYHALEAFEGLYVYGLWNEHGGILGASPEILFHQKNAQIHTMALAGTCPKSEQNNRINLLKDPKELHEHNLVVKDISERLNKLGWLQIEETKIVEFPTLLHLQTNIVVHLQANSTSHLKTNNQTNDHSPQIHVPISELVKHLHPTAALGVVPRNYGIQWLKELPYQRQRGLFPRSPFCTL